LSGSSVAAFQNTTVVEMCAITNKGSVTKYIYQAKIYIAG